MLVRMLFVLLAGVPVCRGAKGAKGAAYSSYYDADGDVQNADFYDSYNDEIKSPQKMITVMEPITRLKRRDLDDVRTLNPEEIIDVKGVLNNILQGKKPESVRGRRTARDHTDSYDYIENSVHVGPEVKSNKGLVPQKWQPTVEVQKWSPTTDDQEYLHDSSSHATEQHWSFEYQPDISTAGENDIIAEVKKMTPLRDPKVPSQSSIGNWRPTQEVQTWRSTEETEETEDTLMYPLESTTYSNSDMQAEVRKWVQHWSTSGTVNQETSSYNNAAMRADVKQMIQSWSPRANVQHQSPSSNVQRESPTSSVQHRGPSIAKEEHKDLSTNVHHWSPSDNIQHRNDSVNVQYWSPTVDVQQWKPISANNQENLPFTASNTDPPSSIETYMDTVGDTPSMVRDPESTTTTTIEPSNMTTLEPTTVTTVKPTTTSQRMDIDAIMAIISNLTYDYEWNLTEQFNKTIIEHGVPTCPWEKWGPGGAWTATTSGTTLFPWDFENTSVVSKCFVCGLRTPEIPRNAFCADAFAGDFLPLMPIDAQSRGKIAGFRKYCRYIDTQNYVENPDEPRAIYGRFTGGCSVRWTDITGVYTQRTCRSKFRPLMGKHFASKRMAKLELALVNVENGCIISPMATLLPVSRGISLYARFHACVCSTNWCNRATIEQASCNTLTTILLAYWLVHYP